MAALVLGACVTTAPSVNPQVAAESMQLKNVEQGVYAVPPGGPDTLLHLKDTQDLRILVIQQKFEAISDAHVAALKDWVDKGGTVWIAGAGFDNPSLTALVPYQVQPFEFHKTQTGERGGELVVKDAVDRLQIHDDPLTKDVQQLFVYPRAHFDGTPGLVPLVEMTDKEGAHGTILGVVPVGQGRVILDGTARDPGGFFSKMPGFDPNHPNAVREGESWNAYDWHQLVANARDLTDAAMNGDSTSGS